MFGLDKYPILRRYVFKNLEIYINNRFILFEDINVGDRNYRHLSKH
jgi:hypothetical protein